MHGKTLAAIAALTCGGTALLSAQSSAFHPSASVLFARSRPVMAADPVQVDRTYWKEGALALGIPAGLLGALAFHGLCGESDSPDSNCTGALVGGAVVGFLIGAIPGALIGGQFKKGP